MKWKDSDDIIELEDEVGEGQKGGKAFSINKENVPNGMRQNLIQQIKKPVVLAGTGLVILIVLMIMLIPGADKTADSPQMKAVESKIKMLEDRLSDIERDVKAVAGVTDQSKSIALLEKRVDGLEAVLTKQMDTLSKQLAALGQQKATAATPAKVSTSKTTKGATNQRTKTSYHVVQKGETLYRISLHYGLKVEELLRLNNLQANAVIRPGQKLVVSPSTAR